MSPDKPSPGGSLKAVGILLADFEKLTKIPIIIYYGDYILTTLSNNPGQDMWHIRLEMARLWSDAGNRHGGDATVVYLPEIGTHGNPHFPFSDLNDLKIVDLMVEFLEKQKLN